MKKLNTVFFPDGRSNRQRNYNMCDETSGKMIRVLLDVSDTWGILVKLVICVVPGH